MKVSLLRYSIFFLCLPLFGDGARVREALVRLVAAYPQIVGVTHDAITWDDGTVMAIGCDDPSKKPLDKLNNPTLYDQLEQVSYVPGIHENAPVDDPGRIRYEPFFRTMYGNSPEEVKKNLVAIEWMPRIFGPNTYLLYVTRINNVHEKIKAISMELEELVMQRPEYKSFLAKPGGTYNWRFIANTNRLSNHSFGMTIDINARLSQYWQWDLTEQGRVIQEDVVLQYRNTVPWEIVLIFEKYGFIWGGKWYHYDTMHFEYRPELIQN